jgi:hypothetical protein
VSPTLRLKASITAGGTDVLFPLYTLVSATLTMLDTEKSLYRNPYISLSLLNSNREGNKMKMNKKLKYSVVAATIAFLVFAAYAAYIIGTVKMQWQVSPPPPTASMTPSVVEVPIGTLYFGETKTVDPAKVAELTVENGAMDITVSLGGEYSGLSVLSVTLKLVQSGNVVYQATVDKTTTSAVISGVKPGTYDVYIGFTVTAGNVACSGEATLSISC